MHHKFELLEYVCYRCLAMHTVQPLLNIYYSKISGLHAIHTCVLSLIYYARVLMQLLFVQ